MACFRKLIPVLPLLFVMALAVPLAAQQGYRPPNLEKEIFDTGAIRLDRYDRAGLTSALVGVASEFNDVKEIDFELRSHALAIAARLDANDKELETTLNHLKEDGKTYGPKGDRRWSALLIHGGIEALRRFPDNKDNLICAAYCADIGVRVAPEGEIADRLKSVRDELKAAGHSADWTDMLGDVIRHAPTPWDEPAEFVEAKVNMPGGEAKSFKQPQSRVNSLVVMQLANGAQAGAASMVNATALREADQKGLLFTFNQEVGPMMGGSLQEVIKFLRVRYQDKEDLVPEGFRIELGFQNKYSPKDGPSAATAFTLLIDSLFSGEKIDEEFACTGDMTSDGMVQRIGGTAGKIRGATTAGCRIVGIPVRNGPEVSDVLLLDGPQQLLDIQIFTLRDFDEAYALSRAEKSAEVQAVLDAFALVAERVKKDGFDLLKTPAARERLEDITRKMPNHLSARLLLEYSKGTNPKTLTLAGCFTEVEMAASNVFRQIYGLVRPGIMIVNGELRRSEPGKLEVSSEQRKDAIESVEKLKRLAEFIDPRLEAFNQAAIDTCTAYAEGPKEGESDEEFVERLKENMERFMNAREKMREDPQIMEEILF